VYRLEQQVLSDLQEEGDSGKNVILEFFQEATLEELMATPGCSRKKSELIIEQRPFNTWTDMVGRCRRTAWVDKSLYYGNLVIYGNKTFKPYPYDLEYKAVIGFSRWFKVWKGRSQT